MINFSREIKKYYTFDGNQWKGLLGGYDGWGCAAASLVTLGIAYAMDRRRSNEDN